MPAERPRLRNVSTRAKDSVADTVSGLSQLATDEKVDRLETILVEVEGWELG